MICFQVGKEVPEEYMDLLPSSYWEIDSANAVSTSPLNIFIMLADIEKSEIDDFHSLLRFGSVEIDGIAFLVLRFKTMSFDCTVKNMATTSNKENAVNLILVDRANFTILGVRTLGVKEDIMQTLINNVISESRYSSDGEYRVNVNLIRNKYSTDDLLGMAKLQSFVEL